MTCHFLYLAQVDERKEAIGQPSFCLAIYHSWSHSEMDLWARQAGSISSWWTTDPCPCPIVLRAAVWVGSISAPLWGSTVMVSCQYTAWAILDIEAWAILPFPYTWASLLVMLVCAHGLPEWSASRNVVQVDRSKYLVTSSFVWLSWGLGKLWNGAPCQSQWRAVETSLLDWEMFVSDTLHREQSCLWV